VNAKAAWESAQDATGGLQHSPNLIFWFCPSALAKIAVSINLDITSSQARSQVFSRGGGLKLWKQKP